ncbi:MAG: ribose 5-phosphate isomerase B [Flavobacteriales bacterium]
MKIAIGCDHAGPQLKSKIVHHLKRDDLDIIDVGTHSEDRVDYPDFAHQVADLVSSGECDWGILICGSANGVAMTANKHKGIRAAIAWKRELAVLAKEHNNANVLCIPARFVSETDALDLVEGFKCSKFEGGRHENRVRKIALSVVSMLLISGLGTGWGQTPVELVQADLAQTYAATIQADELRQHLSILASDAYEGRETGTTGADKAAAYIAAYFDTLGIAPYDGETYYQDVPMESAQIRGGTMQWAEYTWNLFDDFVLYPGLMEDAMDSLSVVFAGYGIQDSLWNDYQNLDVKNKVVVVLDGDPRDQNRISYVTGEVGPNEWSQGSEAKRLAAAQAGARSLIIVNHEFGMTKGRLKGWISRRSVRLKREEVPNAISTSLPTFFIPERLGDAFLRNTKAGSVAKAKAKANKKGKIWRGDVEESAWSFLLDRDAKEFMGANVLGYIPGRDSLLKDELVVITAHYDHVGIIDGEIHNGADDDGSGTVTVLELAQAFAKSVEAGHGPRRSLLLMTVVGEEKGLLGSEWYSNHPVFPLEQTVSNLNIDMIGRVDETHADSEPYVYLIGSDKLSTELHAISEAANRENTQLELDYTFNDPDDPNRFYYRSDHYNFAKNNIPVIFYFSGVHEDYHKPGDDTEKIMFEKTATIGQLVFHTAWQLLNQDKRIEVDVKNNFPSDR